MKDASEFIDSRSIQLWESLNQTHVITLQASKNQEYSCYTQGNDAIIYVDYNNICKDSFTHELLHIYLKQKEFYLGSSLKLTIAQSKILQRLLSANLLEHIGNCLDHLKMFEVYVDLGFDASKFLFDFHDYKCTSEELNQLRKFYKTNNKINLHAVDFYVGKLIAMLCDPNPGHDYSQPLQVFKSLDPALYEAVVELIEETNHYKLDKEDIFSSYRDIASSFYKKLINWIRINKVI